MRVVNLKTAAVEIHQAILQGKRQDLPSPFFFMVGAGISHPPLPLAGEIQATCQEEAKNFGIEAPPASDTAIDAYSYWFEKAYPQPENRQRFLRGLMENAFISRANFRLAHLLLKNTVTNLVVTPNFDDFLSRALSLFGRRHIVCDHPRTLERIDLRAEDVQIIHIHGSYWFYECCNLTEEISERAKSSAETSATMLSMLDDILRARSPLVVGYSGWEGDVFMDALRRRLTTPLRTKVYWFCYRLRDAENLPKWLTNTPNVCIVAPEAAASASTPGGGGGEEQSLEARAVFDALIQRFELDAPSLTKDPLGFFAEQLRTSLLGDKPDDAENDVYAIRSVIDRLNRLRQGEGERDAMPHSEQALEAFRNSIRQSQFSGAVHLAQRIPLNDLSAENLSELIAALGDAAATLRDAPAEQLVALDSILSAAGKLEELRPPDLFTRGQTANALVNKAAILSSLNRHEEAVRVNAEALQRFREATEPALREPVAKALLRQGAFLGILQRADEAIKFFDEVLLRFGDATEPVLREQVAWALNNKGYALCILNRYQDGISVLGELRSRFGESTELAIQRALAKGLGNLAGALGHFERWEEAISACDEVVRRYIDTSDPELREQAAKSMCNKGYALQSLKRTEEAKAAYDAVSQRFGGAVEPALRDAVAWARTARAALG